MIENHKRELSKTKGFYVAITLENEYGEMKSFSNARGDKKVTNNKTHAEFLAVNNKVIKTGKNIKILLTLPPCEKCLGILECFDIVGIEYICDPRSKSKKQYIINSKIPIKKVANSNEDIRKITRTVRTIINSKSHKNMRNNS